MKEFWALFKQSIIVQALVTLILVVVISIMVIKQLPIPEWYTGLFFTVIGFWFGSKVGYAQATDPRQYRQGEKTNGS